MAKRFDKAKEYTIKYGKALLPCQHCGNKDIRIVSCRSIFPPKNEWFCCCSCGDCSSNSSSVKIAISNWNSHSTSKIVTI